MRPILFASLRDLNRAENIRAVYEAYRGEKKFIKLNGFRFSYEVNYSDYDLIVSDEYPAETPRRALMIGHAVSGGKLYGLDQRERFMSERDSRLLSAVTCSSVGTVGIVAKQSGVDPSIVHPTGVPRTDALIGKRKGDGRTALADKRAYLYVPTYRGPREPQMPLIDWQYIDDELNDNEILAIKPHMLTGDAIVRGLKHIVAISADEPSNPYLIDCDVVITDYSSILFDAHIAGKSVVLFEKDAALYKMFRGMYLPYPNGYSSRHCTNERDLIRLLRDTSGPNEADRACFDRCCSACDGNATGRVLSLIEELIHG